MDKAVRDLAQGDVLIQDGRIVDVGPRLRAPDAEVIDASDTIVMPSFVDTHSHLWNAFLRGSVRGDDRIRGYFPTTNRAAPLCTPDDAFTSARLASMETALSGVTCINNLSHNTRSVAHAEAEIRGSMDVGMRTRFSYGTPGRGEKLDRDAVAKVKGQWGSKSSLLKLGVNLQLPSPEVLKSGGEDAHFVEEIEFARKHGLPISLHYGNTAHGLGPDILMIHTQGFTPEERATMVAKNVQFSMSPAIEIPYSTVRNGYIQFAELEQLGASLSLSVDASSASATYDFFTAMRALQWSHKQRSDVDRTLEPMRIVEVATIGGATALQIDKEIGSLTLGKRADIILIRKTDINMVRVIDPYYSLVYSGGPGNVKTVIIDGNIIIRDGKHSTLDISEVAEAAGRAGREVHAKLEQIIETSKEDSSKINRKG
jgi:cytosine/adenosine deaminase-related metal-dependent hydrolase